MNRRRSDNPTFLTLPAPARAYVAAVVAGGAACLVAAALDVSLQHAGLFAVLLGLALATSAAKIELPLGRRSQSNLSLSHAVTSQQAGAERAVLSAPGGPALTKSTHK